MSQINCFIISNWLLLLKSVCTTEVSLRRVGTQSKANISGHKILYYILAELRISVYNTDISFIKHITFCNAVCNIRIIISFWKIFIWNSFGPIYYLLLNCRVLPAGCIWPHFASRSLKRSMISLKYAIEPLCLYIV